MRHANYTNFERISEHTLYTWDLQYAHVGFALFFTQFYETYYRVNTLKKS